MIYHNPVFNWRHNTQRSKYLGKKGKLLGFTVIRVKPKHMESIPDYCVGLIQIDNHQIMARLSDVDHDQLTIGLKLIGRLRRLLPPTPDSPILYGTVFAPERGEL